MKKQLIVNADDFGLNESITRGTIRAIEQGIVTSVSIAANGRDVDRALAFVRDNPLISVGWHINLTSGRPLAAAPGTPGLFNGLPALLKAAYSRRLDPDRVRAECAAQWSSMQEAGIPVTHIDSHHNIHVWPGVRKLLRDVIDNTGVRHVRYSGARMYPRSAAAGVMRSLDHAMLQMLASVFSVGQKTWQDVDFMQFRELYQLADKKNAVYSYIKQLKPGVTVLFCHPGYVDETNNDHLAYNTQRQQELDALCDPECKKQLKNNQVSLISYRDLLDGEKET